ncbi:MAG: redoxin domain-containing protein [Rhodospirillales bacterium]|nr:redoxin domain-containing protein [Rhodospirillales bacterium]
MTLRDELIKTAEALCSEWPDENKRRFRRAVAEVEQSGVVDAAVRCGEMVPDFSLCDPHGDVIGLQALLDRGPVAITVFLASASPLCRLTLSAYARAAEQTGRLGANWIALGTEPAPMAAANLAGNAFVREAGGAWLLSDPGGHICGLFGLLHTPGHDLIDGYRRLGVNCPIGEDGRPLPLPLIATYVVGTDGIASFAEVGVDPLLRTEPQAVVAALKCCPVPQPASRS